jgi:hypothetical protein
MRLGLLSRLKTSSTIRLTRAWSTGSSPSRPPTRETRPGNAGFDIAVKFVGSDILNPLNEVGALYKGGSAQGNVCVAVPAGAEGLWTVSTSFGHPVFFRS